MPLLGGTLLELSPISFRPRSVDLFFYREPEEAKQQEEDEAAVTADHGVANYNTGVGGEQWTAQIADAQWGADATVPPPVAAAQASGWTESAPPPVDGWEMAPAPPAAAAPADGWE